MENAENNSGGKHGFYSKKLKAGKRRTYFFDVKNTKQGDYFLVITESKKKPNSDSYESHKIYLYREDFKKFMESLNETLDYIKTELMPDFDYDAERPAYVPSNNQSSEKTSESSTEQPVSESEKPANDSNNSSSTINPSTPPQIGDDEEIDWN